MGNVAFILVFSEKKWPCGFWPVLPQSRPASLDWLRLCFSQIWVAANVKYLDFVDPAYVEDEKAAQTSNAITHHVAIIAHVRQNWTPNWYGAIFFDERCQVNSIAISCFQAFTCPSPNKCRKSEDIISISEVVSEICCQKRPWSTIVACQISSRHWMLVMMRCCGKIVFTFTNHVNVSSKQGIRWRPQKCYTQCRRNVILCIFIQNYCQYHCYFYLVSLSLFSLISCIIDIIIFIIVINLHRHRFRFLYIYPQHVSIQYVCIYLSLITARWSFKDFGQFRLGKLVQQPWFVIFQGECSANLPLQNNL